jgi:hypothetical protein
MRTMYVERTPLVPLKSYSMVNIVYPHASRVNY